MIRADVAVDDRHYTPLRLTYARENYSETIHLLPYFRLSQRKACEHGHARARARAARVFAESALALPIMAVAQHGGDVGPEAVTPLIPVLVYVPGRRWWKTREVTDYRRAIWPQQ